MGVAGVDAVWACSAGSIAPVQTPGAGVGVGVNECIGGSSDLTGAVGVGVDIVDRVERRQKDAAPGTGKDQVILTHHAEMI